LKQSADAQPTDGQLVSRLNHGDKTAFSELMVRHGSAVYRFAWSLADEPHQADDLMQDTFMVLWKRRRKLELVGESVLPWLLTTCRFTAYNSNRHSRARRTVPLETAGDFSDVRSPAGAIEELAWVRAEIALLEPVDRQLVERCVLEGESYSTAAAALGLTPASARKRIQRTRNRLAAARSEIN